MNLVIALQNIQSSFLTIIATVFGYLGQLPFFVLLFAILFLIVDKNTALKHWLSYAVGFILGSLVLKNIIRRPRPYEINPSLLVQRGSYGSSLPSANAILVATNATFVFNSAKKNKTKFQKTLFAIILIIISLVAGVSQIYFPYNYLLDVIVGLAIGWIISIIVIKFVKFNNLRVCFFICFPVLILYLLFFASSLFSNDFTNSAILEFIGISSSVLLGMNIEKKFINYQIKNNIYFTSFKVLLTIVVLSAYYYLCYYFLTGILFFSFLKYFIAGLIITTLLPLLFKKLQKYFYVFSKEVDLSKVVISKISLSEKGTAKISKEILSTLHQGETVLLSGDLGAGKSVVVRNILINAGVKKAITSPTFVIVNNYTSNMGDFYHFDMYRIDDEEEIVNIGFEEIIDKKDSIKFIEWPEKAINYLPSKYKKITIVKLGRKTRNIILEDYQNN